MNLPQKITTTILFPFADSIERESKQWMATCKCGVSASIWDRGGVRWKARGDLKKLIYCPECSKHTWHNVAKSDL